MDSGAFEYLWTVVNGRTERKGGSATPIGNCSKSISPMARAGALRLPDELFDQSYRVPKPEETVRYLINEFEPAFDAADFSRCGRDLFVTPQRRDERGQDCWLRRQPRRSGLRIRKVESRCSRPTYIDTTFVPLAQGKVPENLVLEASQPTRQRALKDSLLTDLSPARSAAPHWTPGAAARSRIISWWLPSPRATPAIRRSKLSAVRYVSGVFPDRCPGQQSAAGRENHRTLDDNGRFLNAHETVLRCGAYVGLGGQRSWPSFDPGDQVHLPQWRVVGIGVAGARRIWGRCKHVALAEIREDKNVVYRAGARERSEVLRNEISIKARRDLLGGSDGAWPGTGVNPDFRCNVKRRLTVKEPYLQRQADAR
jgi:hypothetical protein